MSLFCRSTGPSLSRMSAATLARQRGVWLLLSLAVLSPVALAQSIDPAPPAAPTKASLPSKPAPRLLDSSFSSDLPWRELTPAQQTALQPLAAKWPTLKESQKRKWIAIASGYPAMSEPDRTLIHSRMTEWASLSQQQRAQARLNFSQAKKLAPTQKSATWQAYQELSPEERQKLAKSATPKPSGATAIVRPVSPVKMPRVPVITKPTVQRPVKAAPPGQTIHRGTMLPRPAAPTEPPLVPTSGPTEALSQ